MSRTSSCSLSISLSHRQAQTVGAGMTSKPRAVAKVLSSLMRSGSSNSLSAIGNERSDPRKVSGCSERQGKVEVEVGVLFEQR